MSALCLCCETELLGEYCHKCGQKVQPLKLTLRGFAARWLRETFEADGRLGRTFGPMFLKPGFLAREYLAGKRAHYTAPLKLFIFSAVVGFLILGLFFKSGVKINLNTEAGTYGTGWLGQQMDLLTRLGPQEMYSRLESGFYEAAPTVLALMLPLAALILKILYPRRGYVEHIVFSLHQHAVVMLFMVPILLSRSLLVATLGLGVCAIHMLFALRTTYPRSWPATLLTWGVGLTAYGFLVWGGIVAAFFLAVAKS